MKATAGRPQSVGRVATAGRTQPVEHGRVSLTSSLVWSLVLHGALGLWLLGSAWLLSRSRPYRLAPQTVFLVGDSPVAIDQVLGEGGGVPAAKPDSKEPGGGNRHRWRLVLHHQWKNLLHLWKSLSHLHPNPWWKKPLLLRRRSPWWKKRRRRRRSPWWRRRRLLLLSRSP